MSSPVRMGLVLTSWVALVSLGAAIWGGWTLTHYGVFWGTSLLVFLDYLCLSWTAALMLRLLGEKRVQKWKQAVFFVGVVLGRVVPWGGLCWLLVQYRPTQFGPSYLLGWCLLPLLPFLTKKANDNSIS